MSNIRVLHVGLGPIGTAILAQIATRPGFKIVGGVDIDPAMLGRDLGDVAGLNRRLGLRVLNDTAKALKAAKPDVVVHCNRSSVYKVLSQLAAVLHANT